MSSWYSTKRATAIAEDCLGGVCIYHATKIVQWSPDKRRVVLNSGGYRTVTTKRRMNEVAEHEALGYRVRQVKHVWWVSHKGTLRLFEDGMVLER